jgi:hypothetical protein
LGTSRASLCHHANDVRALRQAHVGVALIGEDTSEKRRKEEGKEGEEKKALAPALSLKPAPQLSKWQQMMQLTKRVQQEQMAVEFKICMLSSLHHVRLNERV